MQHAEGHLKDCMDVLVGWVQCRVRTGEYDTNQYALCEDAADVFDLRRADGSLPDWLPRIVQHEMSVYAPNLSNERQLNPDYGLDYGR
jgi:hypothetical protein